MATYGFHSFPFCESSLFLAVLLVWSLQKAGIGLV
jgi:hypothetical protein